jgi:hypothetical protein
MTRLPGNKKTITPRLSIVCWADRNADDADGADQHG